MLEAPKQYLIVEQKGICRSLPYDAMGDHPNLELQASLQGLGERLVVNREAKQCHDAMVAAFEGLDAGYHA